MDQESKSENSKLNERDEEVIKQTEKAPSNENGNEKLKTEVKEESVVQPKQEEVQQTQVSTEDLEDADEEDTEEVEIEESSDSEDQENSTITARKEMTTESHENPPVEEKFNSTNEQPIEKTQSIKEEITADTPISEAVEQTVTTTALNEILEKEETNEIRKNQEADDIDFKQKNELNPSMVPEVTNIKKNESQKHVSFTQVEKHETVNNTIHEIISDIDSNIKEQEKIALLKLEEERLLKKQQELAQEIQEQQILSKKLATENDLMQQQYQKQQHQFQKQQEMNLQQQQQQHQQQNQKQHQFQREEQMNLSALHPQLQQQHKLHSQNVENLLTPQNIHTRFSTHEEKKEGDTVIKRTEMYEAKESSNTTKGIDLQKIFTPATDAEEIVPKNRKLYASSAFYTPGLHPTVEDQVELARRISHSLSDISNQQSKGQSMYVNRKKRSVKWVHEGQAGMTEHEVHCEEELKENSGESESKWTPPDKVPLRLLMNPRGKVRDFSSQRDALNVETGLLSPEKCAELVSALQTQQGRGAELFAKRRKKADNWVVDESTASTHSPSGLPDNHLYQAPSPKPPTSPSILPAYSDAGKHRVQLNLHQEQLIEKYAKPGIKVVKSPWEAALESGSASTAFVEETNPQYHSKATTPAPAPTPSPGLHDPYPAVYKSSAVNNYQIQENDQTHKSINNYQRDLAYKPSLPQGWKAPSVSLPKDAEPTALEEEEHTKNIEKKNQSDLNLSEHSFLGFNGSEQDYNLEVINIKLGHIYPPLNVCDQDKSKSTDLENGNDVRIKKPKENYRRINVQKQLEQFETQQKELTIQKKQEEYLKTKRYQNQRAWKWQEKQNILLEDSNSNKNVIKSEEPTTGSCVYQTNDENEYVKVAVRDLIESFEQQAISDSQEDAKKIDSMQIELVSTSCDNTKISNEKLEEKELYVPKEIPLECYAPPPAVNIKAIPPYSNQNQSQSQQKHLLSPALSPVPVSPSRRYVAPSNNEYNKFPVGIKSNPNNDFNSGKLQFPNSTNLPPKQQYWEPTSYQKVPQPNVGQNLSQVNFNPSPLPYEKLAKFQSSEYDEARKQYGGTSQQPYLSPNLPTLVRNTSPAPFGAKRSPQPSSHSPPPQNFPCQTRHNYSSMTSSMTSSHFRTNDLLRAPTFNNPARGWNTVTGKSNHMYTYTKPNLPLTVGDNLPYSDF